MTYRLLINYYTAHERHFCFLVPFFFVCDSFSLYLNFLLTMSSNQSENETNKYADKNRLPYRHLLWVFVSKVKLLWLRETSTISSSITSLSIEYLYKFPVLAFEPNAIPLSFKSCFRTAIVIFLAGPCFIRSI